MIEEYEVQPPRRYRIGIILCLIGAVAVFFEMSGGKTSERALVEGAFFSIPLLFSAVGVFVAKKGTLRMIIFAALYAFLGFASLFIFFDFIWPEL